jgi:hypothetical protein
MNLSVLLLLAIVWGGSVPAWALSVQCEVRTAMSHTPLLQAEDFFSGTGEGNATGGGAFRLKVAAADVSYDHDSYVTVELWDRISNQILFASSWPGSMEGLRNGNPILGYATIYPEGKGPEEGLSIGCFFKP